MAAKPGTLARRTRAFLTDGGPIRDQPTNLLRRVPRPSSYAETQIEPEESVEVLKSHRPQKQWAGSRQPGESRRRRSPQPPGGWPSVRAPSGGSNGRLATACRFLHCDSRLSTRSSCRLNSNKQCHWDQQAVQAAALLDLQSRKRP